jgi:hypothetical protein
MTASGFALFLSLALLPHASHAVPVLRREPLSVQLSPRGEMANTQKQHHGHKLNMVKEAHTAQTKLSSKDNAADYCNIDFPLGQADTQPGNCTNGNETLISKLDCEEAITVSAAGTPTHLQISGERYENARPKGCFKYSCSESAKGVCYFYNGIGDWPDATLADTKYNESFVGTPICKRDKYVMGTNDTNAGCPGGYKAITSDDVADQLQHENLCFLVANCLSYDRGDEFRIGEHNASKHLDFPRGCFKDNDGLVEGKPGSVYFNPKTAEGFGADGVVKGTPICKVNSYVKWDASGNAVATEVVAHDDYNEHHKARFDAGANDTKAVAANDAATAAAASPAAATM